MKDLKIKVCGMKYPDNIAALSNLKPDYMGFIFYPPSKRFVGLDFEKQHLSSVKIETKKTAVFVNAHLHEVEEFSNIYGFKTLQLHGNETPEFCATLKEKGFSIIKAFGVDEHFNFEVLKPYLVAVDFFLFDTKTDLHGGSGLTFSWQILDNYKLERPFFLSGGIDLNNIEAALSINNQYFYGIDINSKFEIEPGLKDIKKVEEIFSKIKK